MTWNVNGLRSAVKNGLVEVVRRHRPDVLLLQELKCGDEPAKQLLEPLRGEHRVVLRPSTQPGRAGVGILTRGDHHAVPLLIDRPDLDSEGRLVGVAFEEIEWWSCYAPSGASKKTRLALKHEFLRRLTQTAIERGTAQAIVLGGDLNVAHGLLDLEGEPPKRAGPGFLPVEREMFDALAAAGWTDLVRAPRPEERGPFTWRSRTRGWRLDHLWASPGVAFVPSAVTTAIGPSTSDHDALIVDLVGQ